MAEAMSAERLARLRADNEPIGDHLSGLTADEVGELLDEVERLRNANYYVNQGTVFYQQKYDDVVRERDQGRAAAVVYEANEKLRAERDELRAQLAEIGETRRELKELAANQAAGDEEGADFAAGYANGLGDAYRAAASLLDDGEASE